MPLEFNKQCSSPELYQLYGSYKHAPAFLGHSQYPTRWGGGIFRGRRPTWTFKVRVGACPSQLVESKSITTPTDEPDTRRDVLIEAHDALRARALADGTWINSQRLRLEDLRGRVVGLDFWTFGCYNCRNTLPALKRWDARYRERGLTIIRVHSPEFDREKNIESGRREVRSLGIRYAVVTDNDYETWRAYGIEAWPTVVILDKQGRIRWTHVGEGLYDEQEHVINTLLAE